MFSFQQQSESSACDAHMLTTTKMPSSKSSVSPENSDALGDDAIRTFTNKNAAIITKMTINEDFSVINGKPIPRTKSMRKIQVKSLQANFVICDKKKNIGTTENWCIKIMGRFCVEKIIRSSYFRSPSISNHCNAPHSGYCESGWTYYNETDACYKNFFSATFDSAESLCNTVGGHLTSIHSYKENAFVAELARKGQTVGAAVETTWIGLVRSDHLDRSLPVKWMWTDGTKVDYLQWTPDHPGADSERCVLLWSDPFENGYYSTWYRKWANYPCRITVRSFVCKKMACYCNA